MAGSFGAVMRLSFMRNPAIALCACLLAIGCTTAAPPPADTSQNEGSSPILEGEWRVAGINGEDFDEPYGIALSASEREIWWSPRCARQSVTYAIEGNHFRWTPPKSRLDSPVAVCAIAVPPRLPEIIETIRMADRIERPPENGSRLSGNGRSLTLFSQ